MAAHNRVRIEKLQFSVELFQPNVRHVRQVRTVVGYSPGDDLTVEATPVFVGYQHLHLRNAGPDKRRI